MSVTEFDVRVWSMHGAEVGHRPRTSPTVFILDDDRTVVADVRGTLRANGLSVRTWTSGAEFLATYRAQMPGCLVTDPCIQGMGGLDVQRELLARGMDIPIVFMTHQVDMRTTVLGMRAGAVTFLAKPVRPAELVEAVREAIARDASNRARRRDQEAVRARLAQLTPRERQVLRLLATGLMNKQIASELDVAEKTVKVHRGRILMKMQVPCAVALVALLHRANLQISVSHDVMKRERRPSAVGTGRSAPHECAAASL